MGKRVVGGWKRHELYGRLNQISIGYQTFQSKIGAAI
jgi:hypothetical protein